MRKKTQKTTNSEKPVWFITGCSTGFGRELATQVLELGYRTVITARNPADVRRKRRFVYAWTFWARADGPLD